MANNSNDNAREATHTVFAKKREGRRFAVWRWLPVGDARLEKDGVCHVYIDALPTGGWDGYVYVTPIGTPPPAPNPQPQRPGEIEDDDG